MMSSSSRVRQFCRLSSYTLATNKAQKQVQDTIVLCCDAASPGAAFQLPTGLRQPNVGTQVMMVAHAVASKQDIKLSEPTVSEGRIVAAAPTGWLVAADYHAGMGFV
jgi:hypothetical protein